MRALKSIGKRLIRPQGGGSVKDREHHIGKDVREPAGRREQLSKNGRDDSWIVAKDTTAPRAENQLMHLVRVSDSQNEFGPAPHRGFDLAGIAGLILSDPSGIGR